MIDYFRLILSLDDQHLERFVRDWVALKKNEYHEVHRFGGAGDLGRDVVGFVTNQRHQGPWHNFQCKQYVKRRLPYNEALIEIAKTLYHADANGFTFPEQYLFIAPHGLQRSLELLFDKPIELRDILITKWDKVCAKYIVDKQTIPLTPELKARIAAYDFGRVSRIDINHMLAHPHAKLVLHQHFGADPGPAPVGTAPTAIAPTELKYITQLVDAYSIRSATTFATPECVLDDATHGRHFRMQRERFYDADFFKRYYRDNTAAEVLPTFEKDIEHGVFDVYSKSHRDGLDRIDAVMAQAASVQTSGPLAPHARVSVKQGVCHHFANEGRLKWKT
jgi:hypothetical protein